MNKNTLNKLLPEHDVFASFAGHFRCLKKLSEADNLCKNAVQEVLAVHLFGPLAMETSQIRVDGSRYKGNAETKCIFCTTTVPTNNTSFGRYKNIIYDVHIGVCGACQAKQNGGWVSLCDCSCLAKLWGLSCDWVALYTRVVQYVMCIVRQHDA